MINVHLVFQAHIDPIWLWPWQAGLDEALATCRSACDRLDAHPDLIFTRGEAWVYHQIELVDPALFARVRRHVDAGQWEIVGGWWIQPDCNAPSGWAMEKQIAIGKAYFEETFGQFPRIAYNVDSFGHAATLPGYLRAAGQDRYVMMRPQDHEMTLPARVFRWRGYEGGPEVTTFRIANSYNTREIHAAHVLASLKGLPEGVEHTMCFAGVGDHGGGPTERQIAWVREHENAFEGARLVFSSPRRFFDAVADQIPTLPLVTGELQMHAIGCYSVYRPVKTALRRAEHGLHQAEVMQGGDAGLEDAWRKTCFHQFHDTLGGTCLPSAYRQVEDQLGSASAVADEVLQYGLRRRMNDLPDDLRQRIVAFNASDSPFDDFTEFEPWLGMEEWQPHWRLLDEAGAAVPFQRMKPEAMLSLEGSRIVFRQALAPRGLGVLRIDKDGGPPATAPPLTVRLDEMRSDTSAAWTERGLRFSEKITLPLPRLDLITDLSDTWTHGRVWGDMVDRYLDGPVTSPQWNAPCLADIGPVLGAVLQTGTIGGSRLRQEWRVYAGADFVELRLSVHWLETQKVLKLTLPLPRPAQRRTDGILGGWLDRPATGREVPLRDGLLLDLGEGERLGIVCPDVYAVDVTPERVRLTLLRSPYMAHHEPHPGAALRSVVSDQGVHEFRVRFLCGPSVNTGLLDTLALGMQRPPVLADLTRGMPPQEYPDPA